MRSARGTVAARQARARGLLFFLAGALGAALLASGCSSSPSLSAYRTQANGICRSYVPQLRQIYADVALASVRGSTQLKAALHRDLSAIGSGSSQLEALAQPSGTIAGLHKALSTESSQVATLGDLDTALQHGDAQKAQAAESAISRREAPLNLAFNLLGLTRCSSDSPAT